MSEYLTAKIGQYVLLVDGQKKVLLLKIKRSGSWSLPGGRLDRDEKDWEKALSREIFEETGLSAQEFTPFDVKLIEDKYLAKYCVFFTSVLSKKERLKLSQEYSDSMWANKEDISDLAIDDEPKVREVLEKYFSKR